MPDLAILCVSAFTAGFVDSIAGGGGLIQLPMLLIFLNHVPLATVLGTNKFAAISGTSMATVQYARKIQINWRLILLSAAAAFAASFLGARVVSSLNPSILRPVIIILLVIIAGYIFLKKDFGAASTVIPGEKRQRWYALAAGLALGFYDGFFGPGTGSFLIFIFISLFGMSFLVASASSKVINFATNLAALIYFAASGHLQLQVALPMAGFNILGALVGSRLAMLKGNRFVRILFLLVVSAVIVKLSYDMFYHPV